jgi:hypothetical protein
MIVLSALDEIVHCIILQESHISNANSEIRELLPESIGWFVSSETDFGRRVDDADILLDPLGSSCSSLKQIYVCNCNTFTDVTNILFSSMGSYETLFVDDTHLHQIAISEDKSLKYNEGGNLHILVSHVGNNDDVNLLGKVLQVSKLLKPSALFLETQNCISTTYLKHLGTDHISYFSENYNHGQPYNFLYAAKVLNSSLSNHRSSSIGALTKSSSISARDLKVFFFIYK